MTMPAAPAINPVPLHELVADWVERQLTAVVEARPCACGGVVVADPCDPGPGVREHRSEPRHGAWSAATFGEPPIAI